MEEHYYGNCLDGLGEITKISLKIFRVVVFIRTGHPRFRNTSHLLGGIVLVRGLAQETFTRTNNYFDSGVYLNPRPMPK